AILRARASADPSASRLGTVRRACPADRRHAAAQPRAHRGTAQALGGQGLRGPRAALQGRIAAMRVLAFDPGTETGWASFANARSAPVLGTFDLPRGPNHAPRNLALLKAVRALIREHAPDVVAYESVIFTPRDSWHERRLLCGLADMVELAAL